MNRRYEAETEEEHDVNMTPMLDIVFIMLIFFIVTAVFVKPSGIDVTRPEAQTATDVKRVSTVIGVSEDNEIWIDKQQVQLEDVGVLVARLKAENPKGKVVIQADTDSHSGLVVAIVEQLNRIGVAGVSVATNAGDDS